MTAEFTQSQSTITDEVYRAMAASMIQAKSRAPVWVLYTNYRGETSYRHILPLDLRFGSNEWHPSPQYLMVAYDIEKKAIRHFAMIDVQGWFYDDPRGL